MSDPVLLKNWKYCQNRKLKVTSSLLRVVSVLFQTTFTEYDVAFVFLLVGATTVLCL